MKQYIVISLLCSLFAVGVGSAFGQANGKAGQTAALAIGWHDEMNDPGLWHQLGMENPPDVYAARKGSVTLRLPHVPDGYPYQFQWSGVTRAVSADLGRYPILMARISSLEEGSYAHLDVEERDITGKAVRSWRSPTLTRPGITLVDMGKAAGADTRRLTLRLIIGGKLTGARGEYDWVRFVNRNDAAFLQAHADWQKVTSTEPLGDAPLLTPAMLARSGVVPANLTPNMRLHNIEPSMQDGFGSLPTAPRRIHFNLRDILPDTHTGHQRIDFFINTGSSAPPLVTLGDNGGFPEVQAVYARAKINEGVQGITVTLIFVADPSIASNTTIGSKASTPGNPAMAINIWQPSMPGDCMVVKIKPDQK